MTARKTSRRHLLDLTPLYAVVGASELAADKLRELGTEPADAAVTHDGQEATPGRLRDLARLARGARRAPAYVLDQTRLHVARTQETYDDLAGRGRDLARRAEEASPVPTPSTLLRQANADLARRRREAEENARATFAATRDAATVRLGLRRDEGTIVGSLVGDGNLAGDRRTLRDAATDLSSEELRNVRPRRRTSAAARTAAPSPTRQTVEVEPIVKSPVLAGSGVEAGSTVTPATGTTATPRIAGSTARRTRVADAAQRAASAGEGANADAGTDAPVRVRRHRPEEGAAVPAPGADASQPSGVQEAPPVTD